MTPQGTPVLPGRRTARVLANRRLSETGRELVIERGGLSFRAGQLITLHGRDITEDRAYNLAGGETDPELTVLYRVIPSGRLTPQLDRLREGDTVSFTGPYGDFTLRDPARSVLFVATGTGIAPCRSFARTYPGLQLTVLHGARRRDELYYADAFAGFRYVPCVSREPAGTEYSRVSDAVRTLPLEPGTDAYLCGSNAMILDVRELLRGRGVPDDHLFTEPYYYRSLD